MLQAFKPPPGVTFAVVAEKLFALISSTPSHRIDIVFDVYKVVSIKNAEGAKRSSRQEGVTYRNILPGFQVKNWQKLLGIAENIAKIVRFLAR